MTNIVNMQWIVDLDLTKHTRDYVPPNSNPTYPPAPNKNGIEWTYSENDDDFTQWFNTFINKLLVYSNGNYHYLDKDLLQWQSIENVEYNKQLFYDYGVSMSILMENFDTLPDEFEIVTWTDDVISESKQLNGNIIPLPQLAYTKLLHANYGNLESIISNDISELAESSNSNVRYLLTSDNVNWQTWNGTGFEVISPSNYKYLGLSSNELSSIDFSQWKHPLINVGIYLEDSIDNAVISKVNKLEIKQLVPSITPQLSNMNFYVLNTTARIDVTLEGTVLRGILSDADLGRVQYRVLLNDIPYRHSETDEEGWNELSPSPYNINMNLYDETIILPNSNNTVRIEFRDAFGTEDYWESVFYAKKHKGKFTYAFIM